MQRVLDTSELSSLNILVSKNGKLDVQSAAQQQSDREATIE